MELNTVFMTIISFSAVLTVLITILTFIFSSLLNPVKENQAKMEKRLDGMDKRLNSLESDMNEIKLSIQSLTRAVQKLSKDS